MANLQNYLTSNLVTKINLELVYNDFFTPLSVGLASGSDAFTGETFDATPQGGATKDSAIIAIDGGTSPDYFNIDSTAANGTGFDIDFRRPVTSSITITEDNISEYDPDATFTIVNPDNLFDGDFGTDCNFSTATIGETMGFEIDLGDGEYVDNLEIALKNTGVGDLTNELFNISYSINGTDFIVDAFTILGTQLDITGNTFNLFNLEYNENYRRGYSNTLDGGWTQKGKIPKIKKLRVYIDSCTSSLSFDITQLRVNKVEFEEPDGIYLNTINIKYVHGSGLSDTISYQVAYDDEEVFYELGENTHSGYGVTTFNVNSIDRKVKKFRISYPTDGTPGSDLRIYEIVNLTYYPDPPTLLNFEFNDSVLETKAWNSSRYDGKQLEGAVINEFRSGDTSYGKTPVLRKLDRTFYITSDIISLTETGSKDANRMGAPVEDPTLQYIPGFSYVVINQSITVNDDLSITVTNLNDIKFPSNERTGFDRNLQTIIPDGSTVSLKSLNSKVKDRSNIGYNVFFNGGMLQPLFMCWSGELNGSLGVYGPPFAVYNPNGTVFKLATTPGGTTEGVYTWVPEENWGKLGKFYKGGLTPAYLYGGTSNIPLYTSQYTGAASDYIEAFLNNTDQRGFITLLSQPTGSSSPNNYSNVDIDLFDPAIGNPPIRLDEPKSRVGALTVSSWPDIFTNGGVDVINPLKNLSHLSTAQVGEYVTLSGSPFSSYVSMSAKYTFAQEYENAVVSADGGVNFSPGDTHLAEPFTWWGSWQFSILNEERPALLVELNKFQEFPDGIGDVPFVVLPENLHPFIKDNIIHFVAKAGINFGSVTTVPSLNQTNRYPDRIGWKPPKPAPTPELEAAQETKAELTFEQRRRLHREQFEQNRKRRLEKLREEEENSRRNKRRSKRKGRQEDREERKALREERKEKRRENRQENRNERRENRQNRRENRRNRRRNR